MISAHPKVTGEAGLTDSLHGEGPLWVLDSHLWGCCFADERLSLMTRRRVVCPTAPWNNAGLIYVSAPHKIIRMKNVSASSSIFTALPRNWQHIDLWSPAANNNYQPSQSLPWQLSYTNSYFNVWGLTAPVWPFSSYVAQSHLNSHHPFSWSSSLPSFFPHLHIYFLY